jgi:hypothetical protein
MQRDATGENVGSVYAPRLLAGQVRGRVRVDLVA